MIQDYTIKSWKPWENEDGLIRDPHGNYKGSVTFDEYNSEPVDGTFKEQPKVGDKKYGDVVTYQTKAGTTRMKFQGAMRPKDGYTAPSTGGSKSGYQKSPEERDGIFRCNALTNAAFWASSLTPKPDDDMLLDKADKFYKWLKNEAVQVPNQDEAYQPTDEELASMPEDFLRS